MTGQPASDKPGTQTAEAAPPLTYTAVSSRYGPGTQAARERYEELATRDALARAYAQLTASGTYDPARHGTGNTEPLPAAEHLELLALAEYLALLISRPSRWTTPSARARPGSRWPRRWARMRHLHAGRTASGLTDSTTFSPRRRTGSA